MLKTLQYGPIALKIESKISNMASLCNSLVSSHIPSLPPAPYLSPTDFLLILEYMLLHLTSGSVYAVPWDPPLLIPTHPSTQLKKKIPLQGASSKFDIKFYRNAICSHSNLNFSP